MHSMIVLAKPALKFKHSFGSNCRANRVFFSNTSHGNADKHT